MTTRWLKAGGMVCALVALMAMGGCKETKETDYYADWKERNEWFVDSVYKVFLNGEDSRLDTIHLFSDPDGYIVFKHLEPVTDKVNEEDRYGRVENYVREETVIPFMTDIVDVYYKGCLIDGLRFDGYEGDSPKVYDDPATLRVNGVIDGWTEVLQRMSVGERWQVYLPQELAYGSRGSGALIPGYSALVFDMQLHAVHGRSSNAK